MTYRIMCLVSGGVTGTRQALLKSNGQVVTFDSRKAAEKKAEELRKRAAEVNRSGSPPTLNSSLTFDYWVVDERTRLVSLTGEPDRFEFS